MYEFQLPYFVRSEFACKCGCGFSAVDHELYNVLRMVREYFAKPVTITSGCRCAAHNEEIGGTVNSRHMYGIAADIKVKDIDASDVADFLEQQYPDRYGVGRYPTWTHIDVRASKARW